MTIKGHSNKQKFSKSVINDDSFILNNSCLAKHLSADADYADGNAAVADNAAATTQDDNLKNSFCFVASA